VYADRGGLRIFDLNSNTSREVLAIPGITRRRALRPRRLEAVFPAFRGGRRYLARALRPAFAL